MTATRRRLGRPAHEADVRQESDVQDIEERMARMFDDPDLEAGLALLDRSVEELGAALALEEPTSEEALRLRRLKDEVASHALAASVLVTSGASPDSVRPVLVRAAALLSAEPQGAPLRG